MTSSTEKQPNTELILADKKIPARLSIGEVRKAKAEFGLDLGQATAEDAANSPMVRVMSDVLVLSDCLWGFYNEKLKKHGIVSQEDLDEALEKSDLDRVRETFVYAVRGFFPLIWTTYTTMQAIQAGDQEQAITTEMT